MFTIFEINNIIFKCTLINIEFEIYLCNVTIFSIDVDQIFNFNKPFLSLQLYNLTNILNIPQNYDPKLIFQCNDGHTIFNKFISANH